MRLKDFASEIIIDPAKFTAYALNDAHPRGRHKARVFAAVLGYSKVNYESLRQQIEAGAPYAEAKLLREDGYGRHLQVDLDVVGQNGRSAVVRTGWIVVRESDTAYLTTLFVRE